MARDQQSEAATPRARAEKDLEMSVISTIMLQLKRLAGNHERKRVFGYVGARLEDEARVEAAEPPAGA